MQKKTKQSNIEFHSVLKVEFSSKEKEQNKAHNRKSITINSEFVAIVIVVVVIVTDAGAVIIVFILKFTIFESKYLALFSLFLANFISEFLFLGPLVITVILGHVVSSFARFFFNCR